MGTIKQLNRTIEKELRFYHQRFKKGDRVELRHFPEAGQGTVASARVPSMLLINWDCKDRNYLHNKVYLRKV